jgi:dynactin complex subunit
MAFQTKSFIDGKKTAMIYQTTDTIAVCSANDYRCHIYIIFLSKKKGVSRINKYNNITPISFPVFNWLTMYLKNFKNSMSS